MWGVKIESSPSENLWIFFGYLKLWKRCQPKPPCMEIPHIFSFVPSLRKGNILYETGTDSKFPKKYFWNYINIFEFPCHGNIGHKIDYIVLYFSFVVCVNVCVSDKLGIGQSIIKHKDKDNECLLSIN